MVTDGRGFETSPQGCPVDRRDHRLACRLDHIEQRVEIGAARGLAEFADVGAGDEGAAVAAQHDRLDAIVGERGLEMLLEAPADVPRRSEEHTSELQSLMRISYAVF